MRRRSDIRGAGGREDRTPAGFRGETLETRAGRTRSASRAATRSQDRGAERVSPREPGRGPVRSESLGRPLPRAFYDRPAVALARDLIGRLLVCDLPAGRVSGFIVETEAYRGGLDPASHAFRGPTARNRVMFGPPGHAYVYSIYGMHRCLNLVAEPEGRAAAVLLRALAPCEGVDLMRRRRGGEAWEGLARGPGNLGRALGLTPGHNGCDLVAGRLWVSDRPAVKFGLPVTTSSRIGVTRARERPWRFFLAGHPCVSGPRGRGPGRPAVSSRLTPP